MTRSNTETESRLKINAVFRRVALLTGSCLVSAFVVGGIGGRVVMGISAAAAGPEMIGRITENGNRIGEFTVVGTLFLILLVGVFVGLIETVIVVGSDPWLQWMGPLQGFGFGLTALALIGQQPNFGSTDFVILEPASLNVAMFAALSIFFGLGVTGMYWLFDNNLPSASPAPQTYWLGWEGGASLVSDL